MSEERALGSWRQNQLKVILSAAIGIVLFAYTISRVGPAALVEQLPAVGPVLALALVLAAFRFSLQALGWRLAMPPDHRPPVVRSLLAVIGGEAAGYLTWGPVSREPVKAILMSGDVPPRVSLAAAIAERVLYTVAAAGLVTAGLIILAVRTNHSAFVVPGLATVIVAGVVITRWRRFHVTYTMIGLAALQEITNVFETYMIFSWLGATPTLEMAIMFEGLSRLLNSAGAFVPGKLGVSELAGASLADAMNLGTVHGLTLALTRRLRSLIWTGAGVLVLVFSAVHRSQKPSPAADPAIA